MASIGNILSRLALMAAAVLIACGDRGAEAQQPRATGSDSVELSYFPWTKFCLKGGGQNAKQVCYTGTDGRMDSGHVAVAAVVIEPEGEPKKLLRVTLPLGMQLAHGTRIMVDNNPPLQAPYVICFSNGCMADRELTPQLLASLKKGRTLTVQAINSQDAPLSLALPLAEFTKAYDGPPTDPKAFEAIQRKFQEDLEKRSKSKAAPK